MKYRFAPLALIVLAGLLLAAAPAQAADQPKIKIPVREFDAGIISKGDKVNHTFTVKNTGSAALSISQVKPSCGCTVAEYDKDIAPGGEGKIQANIKTDHFGYGPFIKTIRVSSNDPVEPTITLTMRGTIKAYIKVFPKDSILFETKKGYSQTKKLVLHNEEPTPLEIRSVSSDSEYIEVSVKKVKEEKQVETSLVAKPGDYILTVKLTDKAPVGFLSNRNVIVKTNLKKLPELKIQVRARVTAPPAATP